MDTFQRETRAHADKLERDSGLIHGDFNQHNIVVARPFPGAPYALAGVLDLGDCHRAPRLFELALTAAYMAMTSGNVSAVADVLTGYSERRPVAAWAVNLLKVSGSCLLVPLVPLIYLRFGLS